MATLLSLSICRPIDASATTAGISLVTIQLLKPTYIGYTTASVNVRLSQSTDSEILDTYIFNTQIEYSDYDDEWVSINHDGQTTYIKTTFQSSPVRILIMMLRRRPGTNHSWITI